MQAWKALRTNDAFARAMGFDGRDGEWERLMLAFGDLNKEGTKNISFEEFRRVLLSAGEAEDGPAATAAGTQSRAMSKLRAAIHASTAFRATADAPPPPPPESSGGPEDLPPPPPSSPSWFDSNF